MYKRFSMILMSLLMAAIMIACGRNAEDESREDEAEEYYEEGRNYLYGLEGYEINLEAAYDNFIKAEENGMREANYYLGRLCDEYAYPKRDYVKAKEYYDACGNNPYAKLAIGFMHYYGNGMIEDAETAEDIFRSVIDEGCVEGYLGLGSLADDYITELEYYTKIQLEGTEEGLIAEAMSRSGYIYEFGLGVEIDYETAMDLYEKAVELGDSTGMNNIGHMYKNGYGINQDYEMAMDWYKKAVELGNESAMCNIGNMYFNGCGVDVDYAEAMDWYEKAADLENATAMNNLAYMYECGYGVEVDYWKAYMWYEKAFEYGCTQAGESAKYLERFLD